MGETAHNTINIENTTQDNFLISFRRLYRVVLAQDCSNPIANALKLLQSSAKPLAYPSSIPVITQIAIYPELGGGGGGGEFPPFSYFPICSGSLKHTLVIEYHVDIWQVATQLSCGDSKNLKLLSQIQNCFFTEKLMNGAWVPPRVVVLIKHIYTHINQLRFQYLW